MISLRIRQYLLSKNLILVTEQLDRDAGSFEKLTLEIEKLSEKLDSSIQFLVGVESQIKRSLKTLLIKRGEC